MDRPLLLIANGMTTKTAKLDRLETLLDARRELPPPPARRALRMAAGVSTTDVGEACGVSRQAVSAWELGSRTPRGQTLESYVAVLRLLKDA